MEITKHFFLNLSVIVILLFFCFIFLERNKKWTLSKHPLIFFFIVLLWICIQFSYHPSPHTRYDLRIIPLVIGGYYAGIGPILIAATIIIRGLYGVDLGFYLTLAFYIPFGFVVWQLYSWFWERSPARRIEIAVINSLILGLLTMSGVQLNGTDSSLLDAFTAYILIPPLGVFIISYSIEFFKKNAEMRQRLIKTEKLKAVEQMGAAISHEIRNPLTAASGFVQLLQDDYLPRQKRKEYLSIVMDELQSAERVIQDYLTFAKPSLESLEEINVKSELRQTLNILQPLANQNSVEIHTDFSILGFIKGDKQKFQQCIINILKNAIESMPNGGYLTVSTEFSQTEVTITVTDTGEGMTSEQLARLGEPFYSTKGKNGTGLGMMVVYSILRAMEGSIKVESKVGTGTTICITFPTISLTKEKQSRQS
ncbi:HAMP domain-containing sensor histidine kinase [Neobacillus mesonae]|uniref:sensor histidine kinase n=1 Tax=Neobacillus mesonae TaxID=1193713 RepID=UPI00203ABEAF|nr:HAMP domain-containing sensor histidine kinase [Neobacillus mesonae]MCM3567972.1 HAMP domain-containing histidine kinase [Neobacillus mesonae]